MSSRNPLLIGVIALLVIACAAAPRPSLAATDAQTNACRNRVVQTYPGTSPSNISINEVWESNGSVRLDWSAGGNQSGLCVIGPGNQVYQFVNNAPAWQNGSTWQAPSGNQSFGNVPGLGQFSVVNNSGRVNGAVVSFQAYANGSGPSNWNANCSNGRLGQNGNLVQDSPQARYVVGYICNGGPPQQFQANTYNFGNVPGIGQFAVVNGSGSGQNGIVSFQAYVNGSGPSTWTALCNAGALGQSGYQLPVSPQSQYVVGYICNGGAPAQSFVGTPPVQYQNGTVNFGYVAGVGTLAVINGSGSGQNGFVNFQAYVNGLGPSTWTADCNAGRIGQNGNYAPYSQSTQYVASYICNGGPPGGGWVR
ncbi:MAG TPA: hypothetical protein VK216_05040 [Magnetospirillaceae bacterium]|nr:hypothetical protein [Magnetospirillaceae bacterium]